MAVRLLMASDGLSHVTVCVDADHAATSTAVPDPLRNKPKVKLSSDRLLSRLKDEFL